MSAGGTERKQRRDKMERGRRGEKKLGKALTGGLGAVQVVKGTERWGEGDEGERKHKPSSHRTAH